MKKIDMGIQTFVIDSTTGEEKDLHTIVEIYDDNEFTFKTYDENGNYFDLYESDENILRGFGYSSIEELEKDYV